ncbi:MAG: peptidoglycan editing factor PgeF [Bacillota bacterium]|jgi:YfiH family protein
MWQKTEKDDLVYYTLPRWEERGARLVMTTRRGGVSEPPFDTLNLGLHVGDDAAAVVVNRERLLAAVGGDGERFVSAKQVHGREIRYVTAADGGRGFDDYGGAFDDTDGLYTDEKDVWLATFYADCLPLAVFHPEKKLLGLAHAGWKGTYRDIAGALIDAMSVDPAELWCAVGAGIGPCCYEVDEDFYRRFRERYDGADDWFRRAESGRPHFDNAAANVALLTRHGVRRENIDVLSACTCCREDLFFSYRRDQGRTGRHSLLGALI